MRTLLVILDAAFVVVAMAFAYLAHDLLRDLVPFLRGKAPFAEYSLLVYLALPLWLALIRVFKVDQIDRTLPRAGQLALQLLKVHFFGTLVIALVSFVGRIVVNRSIVLLFLVALYAVLFAEKWAIVAYQRYQHRTGQGRERRSNVQAVARQDEEHDDGRAVKRHVPEDHPPVATSRGSRDPEHGEA